VLQSPDEAALRSGSAWPALQWGAEWTRALQAASQREQMLEGIGKGRARLPAPVNRGPAEPSSEGMRWVCTGP
jgi:hypothetical protein